MEGGSFGAGRAGAAMDPVSFARRPQTLLRVASWVFSIAVFGPIINEGYVNTDSGPELRCVFNGNAGACRFGVALGLGAFLACAAFLLLDLRFQQISSVRDRRRAVLLDLGFSGLWSFLWFVGFCFLTNQWQRTAPGPGTLQAGDAARAAIAFSFFSILSWHSPRLGSLCIADYSCIAQSHVNTKRSCRAPFSQRGTSLWSCSWATTLYIVA
ncbi:synaptogyrin-3 isoform X2 [Halichoerus grypus]